MLLVSFLSKLQNCQIVLAGQLQVQTISLSKVLVATGTIPAAECPKAERPLENSKSEKA